MTPLPDVLGTKILAFTPEVSHAQVSKGFAALTKRAMEQEWRALASNPLLAKQVATIVDAPPLCYKKLLNEQREAFLTSTCYDAFVAAQPAFAGSYSRARFEKGAALLIEDAREQDRNLERAWPPTAGEKGIANALGLDPNAPDFPKTATEIRAYLDEPGNQVAMNRISYLTLEGLQLTGIPFEIAQFPMLYNLNLMKNRIRNIPKGILNLSHLHRLSLYENRFDHIPKIFPSDRYFEIHLMKNPITVFSEQMYDHYFSWQNWLGRPFSDNLNADCLGSCFVFGCFFHTNAYANDYISLSKNSLKEMPFALWIREKLVIPNIFHWLWGVFDRQFGDLNWMPECLKWTGLFIFLGLIAIVGPFFWLLNQTLSLIVVPIVTKVRELLGYGRMIRTGR